MGSGCGVHGVRGVLEGRAGAAVQVGRRSCGCAGEARCCCGAGTVSSGCESCVVTANIWWSLPEAGCGRRP